jgi:hypothetical protein
MTRRLIFGRVALGFLVMYVASQTKLAAQPLECPAESSGALMQASYPAYTDATQLAQELSANGYIVRCIARSVFETWTPITKGAALYVTNRGSFDVMFLSKPQNFDSLEIAERQKNGVYIYTFRGQPRFSQMEGKRTYFFKQSNRLFIAFDKQTATSLAELMSSNPK